MLFLKNLSSWKNINFKIEILAGLTVAMTMIPESLSFAILAGLNPLIGLYGAFIMGLVTALLGGRPGMVSGGAGATIVVLIALITQHGIEYLFATLLLAGSIQLLVGVFKLGKFVALIPQPVMYGFLNGLAIIIFMAQVEQFKVHDIAGTTWMGGSALTLMMGLVIATICIVLLFPKIIKTIPSSLIAIVIISLIVSIFHIDTKKVADIADIQGGLPQFHIPSIPLTLETLTIIFPYALIMAAVGLIESLLTLNMVDEMTNTKGNSNKEALAQGIANIANGFWGGMGGCAMVAQTMVNLNSGAKTRLSAFIGSITILFIIVYASFWIEQIPMAALVGVMMIVAIKTFQWASIRTLNRFPVADVFVAVLVTTITVVFHNLALAVLAGVIISALVFAWDNATRIHVTRHHDEEGIQYYVIKGPLFFGSTTKFLEHFEVENDYDQIIIDLKDSRVVDMTAIGALEKLHQKYKIKNKSLSLKNLTPESKTLLSTALKNNQIPFTD